VSHAAPASNLDEQSDHELIRLVALGNREALAVLIHRHQAKVVALAFRFLARWEEAEDVCQDAFVRVFERAANYRPTAAFTTWLYRIVANLCLDRRRRQAREPDRLPEAAEELISRDPAASRHDRTNLESRVRDAVALLPDRQRLVLILHRYSDFSYKEIEQITGWSSGAVESCLVRAYSRLRELLADLSERA
jgi:RNA polymerase sigma-70 factor (ECF subfamily)